VAYRVSSFTKETCARIKQNGRYPGRDTAAVDAANRLWDRPETLTAPIAHPRSRSILYQHRADAARRVLGGGENGRGCACGYYPRCFEQGLEAHRLHADEVGEALQMHHRPMAISDAPSTKRCGRRPDRGLPVRTQWKMSWHFVRNRPAFSVIPAIRRIGTGHDETFDLITYFRRMTSRERTCGPH